MEYGVFTDLYELTMAQGYFLSNKHEDIVTFELFYRRNPFGGGYAVACGIFDAIEYIQNYHFSKDEIDYLRSQNIFTEDFLSYLSNLTFSGEVEGVLEGTLVFPFEPIIQITAPLIIAQLIESALLNIINFQTLIATKASRICIATKGENNVLEFGLRRAHGNAAISGAKAAMIGGCSGTSNVAAGKRYGLKISGTHAHSWIQSFETELEAFRTYADIYPENTTLLVDTYDVLKSGIPNAIKVGIEMRERGKELKAIRIDSGDLGWLTIEAIKMLDQAGFNGVKVILSSDLDEYLVESIVNQLIDSELDNRVIDRILWGIGTKLITGATGNVSALGGVYKLVEVNNKPVIKISENPIKTTNPGRKHLWRVKKDGEWIADLIGLNNEEIENRKQKIYHIQDISKSFILSDCDKESIHVNLLDYYGDKCEKQVWVESRNRVISQISQIDKTHLRFLNPHIYKVSLTSTLFNLKQEKIKKAKKILK